MRNPTRLAIKSLQVCDVEKHTGGPVHEVEYNYDNLQEGHKSRYGVIEKYFLKLRLCE